MIFTTIQPPQKESTLIHKHPPSFCTFYFKNSFFPPLPCAPAAQSVRSWCAPILKTTPVFPH